MALYLEFDEVVRRFRRMRMRYAVAGGLAVGLHGYVRATQDMDFLVHPMDLAKVETALVGLGYRANKETLEFARSGLLLKRFFKGLRRQSDVMVVDILIPTSARMRRVLARAIRVPYRKSSLSVVTARDLIAMKRLRGSATDKADIEYLRKGR